jgi:acetyl esterase
MTDILRMPRRAADTARRAVVRGALRLVPRADQPELDPDLRRVSTIFGLARAHELSVALARVSYEVDGRTWSGRNPTGVTVTRSTLTLTGDQTGPARQLQLRSYVPHGQPGKPGAGMMYVHGGGFSIGSVGSHDHVCRVLAARSGVAVQSVEYRLAPEHPFPAGLTDIVRLWAVLRARWIDGGGDPDRFGVGGDSAGGHAALVVADEALEPTLGVNVQMPGFLFAIYPATRSSELDGRVRTVLAKGGLLSGPMTARFTQLHVGDGDLFAPALNPADRSDEVLAGRPRTWIQTVGFDPLRAQGEEYAARLAGLGVDVRHDHEPTMAHGYLSMDGISAGAAAVLHRAARTLGELAFEGS